MHIRCPHCHNAIEIVEDSFKDVGCPSCGSRFNLIGSDDATEAHRQSVRTIVHFELIEHLGTGGSGSVWKAKDTKLDRMVAIKIPRKEQLSDEEMESFLREARAAAQLKHPNIVAVHEVGKQGDTIYIATDYVEGATLKEWLRGRPISPNEAARLCINIAMALEHAHANGVIHRDLKPGNILIDAHGEPHVTDFGLARRESGEISITVDGAVLGTLFYMPPEQAKGKSHEADGRSDVYSLGVMLYEMLTGDVPFKGEKRMVILQIQTEEPPAPRRRFSSIPRDLETICLKCLEKEPERRYHSAQFLARDLQCYVAGDPISARPAGLIRRGSNWTRRHPLAAFFLIAVLVMGIVLGLAAEMIRDQGIHHRAQLAQERLQAEADRSATEACLSRAVLSFNRAITARGNWHEVITRLSYADMDGYPDSVHIAMEKARAYRALNDQPRWISSIESLVAHSDLNHHRGPVLIMHADVLRYRGEFDASMELIREALTLELDPANRMYAEAMIAETTPECLENLQLAVNRDPYHYEAWMMLVASLVLSGRRDQARERAVVAANLFPGDAGFAMWQAVMAAAESDPDEMERWMAQIEAESDQETKELLLSALKTGAAFADEINNMDLKDRSGIRNLSRLVQLAYTVRKIRSSAGPSQARLGAITRSLPMAFHRAYEPLVKLSPTSIAVLFLNKQKLADLLEVASRVHPEGTLYLMLGGQYSNAKRYADAERVFAKAAVTPAILPGVNREAWLMAAAAANIQAADGDAEALARAVGYVRKRVRLGASPPFHSELFLMIANNAQDYDLAQMIIWQVLQAEDQDKKWLLAVVEIEMKWAKWQSALHVLDRLLAREPENKKAQQLKSEILAKQEQDSHDDARPH